MSAAQQCRRFPCGAAYARRGHQPDEQGRVLHTTSVGDRARLEVGGQLVTEWRVDIIAWDDQQWRPYLYVENTRQVFDDPNESAELANKLHLANVWALKANLEAAQAGKVTR